MAVCLSGLRGLPAFDAVGEPETLAQRWTTWKAEFKLYVTASGIRDATQRELFYFTGLDPESDIFSIIQFLPKFAGARKTTT